MSNTLMRPRVATAIKTFPVVEIFGPTIQGEGAEAGLPTHFIRVGGCDYRCSWCDTMYAVDPATVRATSRPLSAEQVLDEVDDLLGAPDWVTISGGNPALHELGSVLGGLHERHYRVSVETQGSLWRDWLAEVDRLTISPKPPSSGMVSAKHAAQVDAFMEQALAQAGDKAVLKIVCFGEVDLAWARHEAARWSELPLYLSAGTPIPAPSDIRRAVGESYRWLCERIATEPDLARARVLPQLHVIAWEAATGV